MTESTCTQCITGTIHPGQPSGKIESIHGLNVYVTGNHANPKATVVLYSDVFGLELPNNKLLADSIASQGNYLVYLPDFFEGDPVKLQLADILIPVDAKSLSAITKYTGLLANVPSFLLWRRRHGFEKTESACMDFLGKLRRETQEKGSKVGIVGYCWGGRFAIRAGLERNQIDIGGIKIPLVDAAVALHPSNLAFPEDVENLAVPVSYGWGQEDTMSGIKQKGKIEAIHEEEKGKGRKVPEMEHKVYKPGRHGFAVRGNPDDEDERAALEGSEKQALAWLAKWL
ncbi:alpha/beta-hydrolase [Massarina eburnea CBS 473.64]|uniref:Alpha/beta-hydrolase n=1 Tax=Massarina eburnea CBS 473.64 TaxID=1395130 RepID=A0A6A6SDT7_9PLEO|nr:alpha/beta-hydrolase [Massarina eburnea CBS 473.64]